MANILVADDEKSVIELVAFLLEKDGHKVRTAGDGQNAMDQVMMERPDLIVMDVMMPVLDGYTLCTRLAADESTRDIPVLILTAKGQMKDVFLLSTNVAAYLEKPFDPNHLRAEIAKILAARAQ